MKKTNILILGSTGFLASYIINEFKSSNTFNLFLFSRSKNKKLDLKSYNSCFKYLKKNKINIIINLIADTNIDNNEISIENSLKNNLLPISSIFKCIDNIKEVKAFIHLSTDQLYLGNKKYSKEVSEIFPLNNYSKTKYLTEEFIKFSKKTIILRTNFFGFNKNYNNNIVGWFVSNSFKKNKKVHGFSNIFFTPLHASTLAKLIKHIIKNLNFGIYNLGSSKRISKFMFLKKISKLSKSLSKIEIINSKYKSLLIQRPKNMSLNSDLFYKTFKTQPININDEILKIKKEINEYDKDF